MRINESIGQGDLSELPEVRQPRRPPSLRPAGTPLGWCLPGGRHPNTVRGTPERNYKILELFFSLKAGQMSRWNFY
jgi:hypothetical protein